MERTAKPTWDEAAEKSILGAMLRNNACVHEVASGLSVDDFYAAANREVYTVILDLVVRRGRIADAVTVADALKERGKVEEVGYAYLVEIWDAAPSNLSIGLYAEIVTGKSLLRRIRRAATEVIEAVDFPEGPPDEVLNLAERLMFDLGRVRSRVESWTLEDAVTSAQTIAEAKVTRTTGGVQTGFEDLDKLIELKAGHLTIVGARPSIGKTAFAINVFYHVAYKNKLPCLFVSLEQGHVEIGARMLCAHASVDGYRAKRGHLHGSERELLRQARDELAPTISWIVDSPHMTIVQILAEARRRMAKDTIHLILVDYLQLVAPDDPREQRYVQVGKISRLLKTMARELNVPVLALCQVGRNAVKDDPQLSDLRESGDIEANADDVLFLHDPNAGDIEARKNNPTSTIKVIVAKQRDGPLGVVPLIFERHFHRFKCLPSEPEGPYLGEF